MKIVKRNQLKIVIFTAMKNRCMLQGHVFVMLKTGFSRDRPMILAPLTKLRPEPEKVHRRPYDGLRCPHEWPDVFTIRAEFENFYHRVSILCLLRDSVTPAMLEYYE